MTDAREAAARALDEYCRRGVWGRGASKQSEDEANAAIDAYIAALAETHAIVPREPTEAMLLDGASAWDAFGGLRRGVNGPRELYRDMLNAAEPQR